MKPTHEEIAVRAYFLWVKAGRPAGRDQDHWFVAEFEVMHDWHKQHRPLLRVAHR